MYNEVFIEQVIIYSFLTLMSAFVVIIYILQKKKENHKTKLLLSEAKENGDNEPVSLYPKVDNNRCIGSGACYRSCPEKGILTILNGKATLLDATKCIGHGSCLNSCPVEAISLWIGTEKRGVDIPDVSETFETNINGLFIAGEIGGMGLIRNAVIQGKEAVQNLSKKINKDISADYDVIIIGAGPAGISASLQAKKEKLKSITFEQNSIGGTVFNFPRSKIIMTHPMELPLFGKLKLYETSKLELLSLWETVIRKHSINIRENTKVSYIKESNNTLIVYTSDGKSYNSKTVVLAIGRRGTPVKLNIEGESLPKVSYSMTDPEHIVEENILIVGGGDSAIEAALLLCEKNKVTLSYRGEKFVRLKIKNKHQIEEAINNSRISVRFQSSVCKITDESVEIIDNLSLKTNSIANNRVLIFAGGEPSSDFLKNCGISMSRKHGELLLKP